MPKQAYVGAHYDGDKDQEIRFVAVLEIPPVNDAKTAVQASIMADSRIPNKKENELV